ncbi:MAG: hypothetical protein JXC32_02305 [Anaerolineae bacterium]|nr:hypothetical protein [Anaerolineae bacterium]
MPEISLNAYENEIDQLIEQARYLEALAHIRHILGQYPHYVGAYYLLGKLMLEVDLPGLAIDMFRRALSADPEHLMARIGLGLAHERANDLDASIWNLERALELDPSNAEISDELRRMYGRRDGTEPDYITQSRAGLARLYIRGDRPGRAGLELRKLLDEEPARPDLMTALAEAYWRDGQLVQASEISQEILDKMPYNCKANLLLGSLWVNSGQDEGWTYLNRAQEIDLNNAMAEKLFGTDSLLERREAELDRLTYDPDAIDVDQSSAWFRRLESASITVGISEAPPEMTEAEVRLVDITAGLESQIEIPDWLRELGAGEEAEEAGELGWMAGVELAVEEEAAEAEGERGPQRAFTEADVAEELEELATSEEEMPEWLQELTTQEMAFDLDEAERTPDWLLELVGEEAPEGGGAAEAVLEPSEAAPSLETAGWLTEFAAEADLGPAGGETVIAEAGEIDLEEAEAAVGEEADWLSELTGLDEAVAAAEGEAVEAEELPDWLDQLQSTVIETGEQAGIEEEVLAAEELPDWLRDLEPSAEQVADLDVETLEALAETGADEIPDWLAELQRPATADLTVLEADIEADIEAAEAAAAPTLEEKAPEQPPSEVAVAPAVAEEPFPQIEEEEALTGEAALAWLDSLTIGEEVTAPSVELEEEIEFAEFEPEPDVRVAATEVAETVVEMPEIEVEPEVAEAELLEAEGAAPWEAGEPADLMSGDDALAWLESLAAGKEEELRAQAQIESEARVAEILGRKPKAPEAPAAEEEPAPPEDVEAEAPEMAEQAEVEVAEAEVAPPTAEAGEELLSGDDALAWLESLAAGKEEELRAQAEAESEARVAEILGRRRPAPAEAPAVEEPAPPADVEPEMAAPPSEAPPVEGAVAGEGIPAEEGEDARAWLQSLAPELQATLEAQLDTSAEATVEEETGYFGWSAFGEVPQEVAEKVARESAPEEAVPGEAAPWEAEPSAEGEEVAEAAPTEAEAIASEPEAEEPEPEPQIEPEPAEPEHEVAGVAEEEPVTAAAPEAAEAPAVAEAVLAEAAPEEPRPEAEVSETPVDDLDQMRDYIKKKRSDHAVRLKLARALWEAGEVQEAMQHYGRLIKSSAKTDDVMADLEAYVQTENVQSNVMRTLGDAYMKFGELDKALEIYNRAMDML